MSGFVYGVPVGSASLADGTYGDVTVSGGGTIITVGSLAITTPKIDTASVTLAKLADIATDSLVGRDTAGTGVPENITLGASLSMDGSGHLQRAALTGDVTASANSNALAIASSAVVTATIRDANVTLAKLADIATDSLIGRDTAGTGVPENITLGTSLSMDGTGKLQRAALTGDITASANSNTTALRSSAARSVIGRSAATSGAPADIAASADGDILRRASGTVGFGSVPSTSVTGLGSLATGSTITIPWAETYYFDKAPIVAAAGTLAVGTAQISDATDSDGHFVGADMADGATTWLHWMFAVPDDIDLATEINVDVGLRESSSNSGDYELTISASQVPRNTVSNAGNAITEPAAFVVASSATAGQYRYHTLGTNLFASLSVNAGDLMIGVLSRNATGGNAADTYTGTLRVAWIKFSGTRKVTVS